MTDAEKILRLLDLKKRAYAVQAQAIALRIKADKNFAAIMAFNDKYPDSAIDQMDWQEKEKVIAEADVLFDQTDAIESELHEVDAEYEDIRTQINAYCGKEVLPPLDKDSKNVFDPGDDADWWKRV
jgi:hypothetical protein